jgi:hypothetical protein
MGSWIASVVIAASSSSTAATQPQQLITHHSCRLGRWWLCSAKVEHPQDPAVARQYSEGDILVVTQGLGAAGGVKLWAPQLLVKGEGPGLQGPHLRMRTSGEASYACQQDSHGPFFHWQGMHS